MSSHTPETGASLPRTGVCFEPHYEVRELAKLWHLSVDVVRRVFENEPGVIKIGHGEQLHRRRYISLRIPASVAERIHRKLTTTGVVTKVVAAYV